MIKRYVYRGVYRLWENYLLLRAKLVRNNGRVYVIDIDNTLTKSVVGAAVNHIKPTPRNELIQYIQDNWYGTGKVIFLSARKLNLLFYTMTWLSQQGLKEVRFRDVYLVESARSKFKFLELLASRNKEVVFIDDMSYNHENGTILYYDEVKNDICNLPITYLGLDFIAEYK